MDESFTLYVHHGGHFSENYEENVEGVVRIVDGYDPDKWSKVEIKSICKEFGYTCVSRLWYTIPGEDDQEGRIFHLIKDDKDAMFMTTLMGGHGHIYVYVQHPVNDPILVNNGNGVTLDLVVEPKCELEPEWYSSSDGELAYKDGDDFYHGDDDFDGHQYFYGGDEDDRGRDDSDSAVEILECKRPGKEPVVEEPQGDGAVTIDSNESFSDTEMEGTREMNPNQWYVGEDSSES